MPHSVIPTDPFPAYAAFPAFSSTSETILSGDAGAIPQASSRFISVIPNPIEPDSYVVTVPSNSVTVTFPASSCSIFAALKNGSSSTPSGAPDSYTIFPFSSKLITLSSPSIIALSAGITSCSDFATVSPVRTDTAINTISTSKKTSFPTPLFFVPAVFTLASPIAAVPFTFVV